MYKFTAEMLIHTVVPLLQGWGAGLVGASVIYLFLLSTWINSAKVSLIKYIIMCLQYSEIEK